MIPQPKSDRRPAFALIVALALMTFILLLLLSLSTLTSVEQKTSTIRAEINKARANALVGLYTALGDLQKMAGPDQRVTGTAELASTDPADGQKYWTGVWNTSNVDRYDTFTTPPVVGWLVSGTNTGGTALEPGDTVQDPITLLNINDGDDTNDVVAGLVTVTEPGSTTTLGHYAYWVGDEGVKAKVNLKDPHRDTDNPQEEQRYSLMAAQRFGVENITIDSDGNTLGDIIDPLAETTSDTLLRLTSGDEYSLVDDALSQLRTLRYHDVTTSSYGVLSDPINGGLKKDLNFAFEMDLDDFEGIEDFSYYAPPYNGPNVNYLFYFNDWGAEAPTSSNAVARGPTWHLLRNYYRLYRSFDPDRYLSYKPGNPAGVVSTPSGHSISARPTFPQIPGDTNDKINGAPEAYYYRNFDPTVSTSYSNNGLTFYFPRPTDMQISPVVVRMQMFMALRAERLAPANYETGDPGTFQVYMHFVPLVTIWNPYNVDLTFEEIRVAWRYFNVLLDFQVTEPNAPIPYAEPPADPLDFNLEDISYPDESTVYHTYLSNLGSSNTANNGNVEVNFVMNLMDEDNGSITLEPGETMVFAYDREEDRPNMNKSWNYDIILHPFSGSGDLPKNAAGFVFDKVQGQTGSNPSQTASASELVVKGYTKLGVSVNVVDPSFVTSFVLVRSLPGGDELKKFGLGTLGRVQGADVIHWPSGIAGDYRLINNIAGNIAPGKFAMGVLDTHLKTADNSSPSTPAQILTHYNPRAPSFSFSTGQNLDTAEDGPIPGNWYCNFDRMTDWGTSKEGIGSGSSGYWGWRNYSGTSRIVMYELPTAPLMSLAALQHVNITPYAQQPGSPIANSYASPFIPKVDLSRTIKGGGYEYTQIDWSYLSNDALWDEYFFSSIAPRPDDGDLADGYDIEEIVTDFVDGGVLPNSRMQFYLNSGETEQGYINKVIDTNTTSSVAANAYQRSAENLMVDGAFNVNSTSVEAWIALLSATNDLAVEYLNNSNNLDVNDSDGAAYSRMSLPGGEYGTGDLNGRWNGFRRLSYDQISDLATQIVEEVKARGPFVSLSDFVNRRLSDDDTGLKGPLQAAIDATDINDRFAEDVTMTDASNTKFKAQMREHAVGKAAAGAPGYLRQSDLLMTLGPVLTSRSDTFVIRAYGDYENPLTNQITQAWCEAVVQRIPEYVDNSSTTGDVPYAAFDDLNSTENQLLGRRFVIVSFRWLDNAEI